MLPAEGRTCNNETQFDCTGAGSRCIGRNKLCDGTPNCPGGEDEDTLLCSTSNLSEKCSNIKIIGIKSFDKRNNNNLILNNLNAIF